MMRSQIYIFTAAALVGICSQEITNVSVKKGSSISLPCLYDSLYTDNKKYLCLCKKNFLGFCQNVVETDQSSKSTKYSIFDDKLQHVFSVTIRNLNDEDNYFLCRVSIPWFVDSEHKILLQLSGMPSLYVDRQSITAVLGGSVTIMCHYSEENNFKWCKLGGECISKSGEMNGLQVSVTKKFKNGSKVTMNGLNHKHRGWYFCQNGGFQMPVNLTVSEEVTTTAYVTNVTNLSTPEPSTTICTNTTTATQPVNFSTTVEKEVDPQPNQNPTTVIVIASITTLVLLTFVIASVASWKMAKCRKSVPTESHTAQGPQTVRDQDVLYSDIIHTQQVSSNNKDELREATVIYSTIVTRDTAQQMSGPPEGSVIYSTVSK